MVETSRQKRIRIGTLKTVFKLEEYRRELEDLSCYGANIKQERPMLYILAKYLYKRGFKPILEKKTNLEKDKHDLVVNDTKIEAKFYYECDLKQRLEREMKRVEWNIQELKEKIKRRKEENKGFSWGMALPIVNDICEKNTDIFVLIILSRDLRGIKEKELAQICWGKYEKEYNEKYDGYDIGDNLRLVDKFFDSVEKVRNFQPNCLKIPINKIFPSTYHIYFCDFQT